MLVKHQMIKERRKKFGYLPQQVAKYIGISLARYNAIESGEDPNLGISKVSRLCSILKLVKHKVCLYTHSDKPQQLSKLIIPGSFGEFLAKTRVKKNMSPMNIAILIDCSDTAYFNYEISKALIPLDKLQAYCKVMDLDITEVLEIKRKCEEYIRNNDIKLPTRATGKGKIGKEFKRILYGSVGHRLKSIREMHHMSRGAMIRKINHRFKTNLASSTVERWETNTTIISLEYAILYCKLFHTSLDYIYGLKNKY